MLPANCWQHWKKVEETYLEPGDKLLLKPVKGKDGQAWITLCHRCRVVFAIAPFF